MSVEAYAGAISGVPSATRGGFTLGGGEPRWQSLFLVRYSLSVHHYSLAALGQNLYSLLQKTFVGKLSVSELSSEVWQRL